MLTPENHYSTLQQNSCLHCVHELGYTLFPLNSHYLKNCHLNAYLAIIHVPPFTTWPVDISSGMEVCGQ